MPQKEGPKVKVSKDGPYLVSGSVPLSKEIIVADKNGDPERWQKGQSYPKRESYALCRCGQSKSNPYCDGTHAKARFNGSENASKEAYAKQARKISGPDLVLMDAPKLCATARFCHRQGGTWELAERSGNPEARKTAIQQACDCPGGRLVACDKKTGNTIEKKFEPSISLVEDPEAGVSGPIWVKGGIPVESSDGTRYEVRNRVTLCRCGRSRNKPFCDGAHVAARYSDE